MRRRGKQGHVKDSGESSARWALAGGLLAGVALDMALGDPRRWHPVAGFGKLATGLEQRMYQDSRLAGTAYALVAAGTPVVAAVAADTVLRRRPLLRAASVAAVTWGVLGGTSLCREATAMGGFLEAGNLTAARKRLPSLCGREPANLDEKDLARATVESVAENTSDAVVAPLFWGAVAGLPGLVGYRAINTLDAMVGHRSTRYARFGTAAARLDDLANLLPARLTAGITVALAPLVGGSRQHAVQILLRDGAQHPSPNSGHCEAAAAGALDVRLGGTNVYSGRVEDRPYLGDGPAPAVADIGRAVRLSRAVGFGAAAVASLLALLRSGKRSRGLIDGAGL